MTRSGTALIIAFIAAAGCGQAPEPRSNAPAPAAAGPADSHTDSTAVAAIVRAHRSAIASRDVAAVASHHHPDLTFFGPESPHFVRVGSDAPETAALLQRLGGSTAQWTPRDVNVQLFGDVAIAAFFIDGSTSYADGTVDTRSRRVSEVWVRNADGNWQEAHHHESPLER